MTAHIPVVSPTSTAATGSRTTVATGTPAWTPLLTPKGWNTYGTLAPGDLLFGSDGHPVAVTQTAHLGVRPTARIVFADRGSILTGLDQPWPVKVGSPEAEQVTLTTRGLMRTLDTTPVWALVPPPVSALPLSTTLGRPLSANEAGRLGTAYATGDDDHYAALLEALGCDPTAIDGWQIPTPVLLGSFAVRVHFLRALVAAPTPAHAPSRVGARDLRSLLRSLGGGSDTHDPSDATAGLPPQVTHLLANPSATPDPVAAQHQGDTTGSLQGLVRVAAALPGIPRDLIALRVDATDGLYATDNLVLTSGWSDPKEQEAWS